MPEKENTPFPDGSVNVPVCLTLLHMHRRRGDAEQETVATRYRGYGVEIPDIPPAAAEAGARGYLSARSMALSASGAMIA